ncbi:hypothetical protein P3342_011231 [Pyrenophora teres f. teres]|nr:hypothetical protein P3342_011231 [Pyrenophora teres f. teres]
MVSFEQHVVLPPETQDRVDKLIRILGSLVIIGMLLLVLTILLVMVGLGIGYMIWKKENGGKARVACHCDGQAIKKTK